MGKGTHFLGQPILNQLLKGSRWGQILGYDGSYDSGTSPHGYPNGRLLTDTSQRQERA